LGVVSEVPAVPEADDVAEVSDVVTEPDADVWPTGCPAACVLTTVLAITAPTAIRATAAVTATVVSNRRRRLVPDWSFGKVCRGAAEGGASGATGLP
jgi:hypothetical protein